MQATIFTEGGRKQGFGHVARCGALAQAFAHYQIKTQLLVEGDKSVLRVAPSGIASEIVDWKNEETIKEISSVEFAILDSYKAPAKLYQLVYDNADVAIFFDDFDRIEYPGGFVINNCQASQANQKDIILLSGLEYLPLRKAFWNTKPKKVNHQIQSVLINFGGSAVSPIVRQIIIETVRDRLPAASIHALAAAPDPAYEGLDIHVHYGLDDAKLADLFTQIDLAISSGGVTLNELAACGVPTIAFALAENQLNNIQSLTSLDLAGFAGETSSSLFREELTSQIESFRLLERRADIVARLHTTVTGKGALNVVKMAFRYFLEKRLVLRTAGLQDEAATLRLSNDPEVRASSFNADIIRPEEHERWFKKKIKDPKTLFLIAEVKNRFAGQIRFDIEGGNALISVSIDQSFRSLGTGRVMMKKAVALLKQQFPGANRATAFLKKENQRSEMFFKGYGFKFAQELEMNGIPAYEYILEL